MDQFTALITDSLQAVEIRASLPLSDQALWDIAGIVEADQSWPGVPSSGGTRIQAATAGDVGEPS